MISFLVFLLFVCIAVYAVCLVLGYLVSKIGVPDPILRLLYLLVAVVALYVLIHRYGKAVGIDL